MANPAVAVAMSGGVDSSVAAAILKKKKFDVLGLTIRVGGSDNRCCSDRDLEDARRVASALKIPHTTVHLPDAFDRNVIRYFVQTYRDGRTPNPCAVCNPSIKFGALYKEAVKLGASRIATGHYARISKEKVNDRHLLRRGKERGKDQSYFLARLKADMLDNILFPIGSYPKKRIRAMAEEWGLPVAFKAESQEVCFIPDGDVAGFIERYSGRRSEPGDILDTEGKRIGTHKGITGYTIGQRKGLGIALGRPVYVVAIDAGTNTVVIGEHEDLYHDSCLCTDPNWIMIDRLEAPKRVIARLRYKHKPKPATITPEPEGGVRLTFDKAQRAITPGQLAVFYEGENVVGSAWIDRVIER
jgi:tRNA-specific 2-thiouridylase